MSDFNLKLTQAFGESLGEYFLTAYRLLQSNFPSKELDDWWLQIEFDITNSFVKQSQEVSGGKHEISKFRKVFGSTKKKEKSVWVHELLFSEFLCFVCCIQRFPSPNCTFQNVGFHLCFLETLTNYFLK